MRTRIFFGPIAMARAHEGSQIPHEEVAPGGRVNPLGHNKTQITTMPELGPREIGPTTTTARVHSHTSTTGRRRCLRRGSVVEKRSEATGVGDEINRAMGKQMAVAQPDVDLDRATFGSQ